MRLPQRHGLAVAVALMGWLTVVLFLDRASADGSLTRQRVLGGLTWLVLLGALACFHRVVRAQAVVVVAFATLVEYVCSPTLEVYLYRFHNVPAYVPPGHGLVYLSAFALGHWTLTHTHLRAATVAVVTLGGVWAGYGVFLADRPDVLGAFWYLCLVGFLRWGPSRPVYVGAAVVVTWLELAGTHLGTWEWMRHDPILGISMGNPPSGAAGGYGWFDLAGLLVAPYVIGLCARLTRDRSRAPAGDAS